MSRYSKLSMIICVIRPILIFPAEKATQEPFVVTRIESSTAILESATLHSTATAAPASLGTHSTSLATDTVEKSEQQNNALTIDESSTVRFVNLSTITVEIQNFTRSNWENGQWQKVVFFSHDNDVKPQIKCYPNGEYTDVTNQVSIYFFVLSAPVSALNITASFSIVLANQSYINKHQYFNWKFTVGGYGWGFHGFISRDTVVGTPGLLRDDSLYIHVQAVALFQTHQSSNSMALLNTPRSTVSRIQMSYKWTVCDLQQSSSSGEAIASPKFPTNQPDFTKFYLAMYPNGYMEEYKSSVSLEFCADSLISLQPLAVHYSMSVVNPITKRILWSDLSQTAVLRLVCWTTHNTISFDDILLFSKPCFQVQFSGSYNVSMNLRT